MEYIEIDDNEALAEAVERANEICIEPIRCHWDGTLFNGNREMYDEHCTKIEDIRFKLGFDHIELLNSEMEEKQNAFLVSSIGNLKTLAMTFIFKLSDTKINGKIRICSVLNQSLESTYKLHLTKVRVKSVVGLYIAEDSYLVDHIIHEFVDASISLIYKKDKKMIPVYNKIQAKHIKHSLVQYLINNSTKNIINMIEAKLRSAFDLTSVSISLGNVFSFRDDFRKRSACISFENDLVVIYVPVDFADLNIEYKSFIVKCGNLESRSFHIQEHYKTEGSYLTFSLRSLEDNKIDLNLLEFKICNFILLDSDNQTYIDSSIRSWINSILDFKVAPVIEETFEKYLRISIHSERFTNSDVFKTDTK